jgi:hypothetical protein
MEWLTECTSALRAAPRLRAVTSLASEATLLTCQCRINLSSFCEARCRSFRSMLYHVGVIATKFVLGNKRRNWARVQPRDIG